LIFLEVKTASSDDVMGHVARWHLAFRIGLATTEPIGLAKIVTWIT
jgi:hypothetical protein